jgi:hypothetical protein
MANGIINISQQALLRAQNTLDWARDLQRSLIQQPQSAQALVERAIVDVEIIDGTQFALKQLVDKVDQRSIQQFKENLRSIDTTLGVLRETLQNRIILLNKTHEDSLLAKAKGIFDQLQQINENLFKTDEPKDVNNVTETAKRTIEQIRSQTKNEETIRFLSRAEEQLQILTETSKLVVKPGTHPAQSNQSTIPSQEQLFLIRTNQYSDTYNQFYQGQPYKRSACTPIAGHFVLETLRGKKSDALNDIMIKGHKINARLMQEHPPQHGEHFEFIDILQEKEFSGLQQAEIPPALFENDPLLFNIDLLKGANSFKEKLKLLSALKDQNKVNTIGAVLTARGESYGVVMFSPKEIVFFDSHGHQPLTQHNTAYAVIFKDIEQASQFLANRMPVVEGVEDLNYNTCTITPVCLKKPTIKNPTINGDIQLDLGDQNIDLPIVETRPRINHELQHSIVAFRNNVVEALAQKNEEGFFEATAQIAELSLRKALFAMTESEPTSIGDRIFFHMYHIHRVESPEKLDGSWDYGTKAFQESASPEERLRAAQRVCIELALTGLEDAITAQDSFTLRQYLDLLEGLNLHENDLPKGTKNIVHALFGKLYFHYKEAAESNKTLVHPHDDAFNGDFGRNAFRENTKITIDPQFKLDVIKQLRNELKQTWRI